MDIAKVAKISRLPASTLRYYEQRGLIKSAGRHGLRRYYSPEVIDTLALITLGRNVGLSLDEISEMLLPDGVEIDRALLLAKANDLDKQISQMIAMRDGLRHAAACKQSSHMACPKFLRLLNISSKKWPRLNSKL